MLAKPRQAMTVIEEMMEHMVSQTKMCFCA